MASRALGGVQAIRDLRAELERGESERGESEHVVVVASIDEVTNAIAWLTGCRRPHGYWGEQQEGTTALAMLAIAKWRSTGERSAVARAAAATFDLGPSADWLGAKARADGSWLTPWYT